MTIRALLLDLDDTLVDHRGAADRGLRTWLTGLGLAQSPAEPGGAWSSAGPFSRRGTTSGRSGASRPTSSSAGCGSGPSCRGGTWPTTRSPTTSSRASWAATRPPGERSTTPRMRSTGPGQPACPSASSPTATRRSRPRSLRRTGLLRADVPVFASSSLPAAKPDPRAYLTACAHLGVDPAATLMVGDSLRHDVVGARRAGLQARLLDRYGRYDERGAGQGVVRVRGLAELDVAGALRG
ncbi:HAD family hydrolase [Nocardioides sp. W3-2-3]|uniref:HAD family hydrolase n=1 Tax=Nocardioides convexus TaxID=2712224 RepID=UPI0024186D9D|nr:HAD family hydrolase [Nocardioides convexus]NHA00760.1 HAD family hydrolase [Nocardioides convexus]